MKKARVVIGANFGDEGKGLFTDYLANRSESLPTVVRFNGGAQAGHTVQTPEGQRHVFSHFGSGSFLGAPTLLSRFFAVNPLLYGRELSALQAQGVTPHLFIDAAAPVTTPYDMMLNQIAEDRRGRGRHGSCGVGFGETIARSEAAGMGLTVSDLTNPDLSDRLQRIRTGWITPRLEALGVTALPPEWQQRLACDAVLDGFVAAARRLLDNSTIVAGGWLRTQDAILFEGAQGLLLDQDSRFFPHVTRSSTGLRNVVPLALEAGVGALDVLYATRSYLTRHGAGPLPFELPAAPYEHIVDLTNKAHPYQGHLRFAPLNFDLLQESITADLAHARGKLKTQLHLGVSCCDQLEARALIVQGGEATLIPSAALLPKLRALLEPVRLLASYGPSRASVEEFGGYASRRRAGAVMFDAAQP